MASTNAVWGIDIGQCALKAIKLRSIGDGEVEAVAFDVVEHDKILSQHDADRDELIKAALEKFTSRNDLQGDKFVIGVPGQQTFARFCKMPPIDLKKDAKKIPELVRYEASQQIPFDMDDVVWDYQVFASESDPDIEVGIFAIRRDLIRKHLGFFTDVGIAPQGVQAVPAALYNFCHFDGQADDEGAVVVVDVGAQSTELIVVEPNSAWTRNIPLGGNAFTEALVRAFKLSFAKAESLKRSAANSKYARQIFQAMRPVFADLVAEIQRSIGFYSAGHREMQLKRVLALGSAFRLPGLQKYLENNLTIEGGTAKLEKFNQIAATATLNAPQFKENLLSFAPAYGLALQGLGLGRIRANLLPPELARIAIWQKKRPYFVATAASLLLAAGIPWVANGLDQQALESERATSAISQARQAISEARGLQSQFREANTDTSSKEQDIQKLLELEDPQEKLLIPRLVTLVHEAIPPLPPALQNIDSAKELRELIQANPGQFPRTERGQLVIESFDLQYTPDLAAESVAPSVESRTSTGGAVTPGGMPGGMPGGPMMPGRGRGRSAQPQQQQSQQPGAGGEGFVIRIQGRLLYGEIRSAASQWFESAFFPRLREQSRKPGLGFYIPDDAPDARGTERSIGEPLIRRYHQTGAGAPGGMPGGVPGRAPTDPTASAVRFPDPVTGEESEDDWAVSFAFKVALGEPPESEEPAAETTPPGGK